MIQEVIHVWKGRPIIELSREELLEVINWCAKESERIRAHRISAAFQLHRMMQELREARK